MTNLTSFSERAYCHAMRRKVHASQERIARFQIVIEAVHPAHFSTLPPAPKELESKAWLLGI